MSRPAVSVPQPASRELVFASWNVQGCSGRRGFDPHAVADALFACGADIAALQECGADGGRAHAEAIARSLGFEVAFGATLEREGWRYGNAVLSRFPLGEVVNVKLPALPSAEPRGCVTAVAHVHPGVEVIAASGHLGLAASERARQAEWLSALSELAGRARPSLIGLDGNDWFPGRDTRSLRARFRDAWRSATCPEKPRVGPRCTYPSEFPVLRLDHVYVAGAVEVVRCEHFDGPRIRRASDHLPVVARVRVASSGESRQDTRPACA